jgi:hypothetical protein
MANATSTLREADNRVVIEGVLKENNLEKTKDKDGKTVVRGDIVVQIAENEEIVAKFYSAELTKTGKENPSFKSLSTAMENYVSVADCLKANEPIENATKVQVKGAKLRINDYFNENKKDISSYVEVAGSFISSSKEETYEPRAEFELECFILNIKPETNKEQEETGRLVLNVAVPIYGGKVVPFTLIAEGDVAEFLSMNYEKNKTAFLLGDIKNTVTINKVEKGGGFGKKKVETFINTKQELIITGGGVNGDPSMYEDNPDMVEKAFAIEDIKKAMAEREVMLETLKSGGVKPKNKQKDIKQAPRGGLF